jgi:hypothetical protein
MAHTRGEIYASIIHDINGGPLTVISGRPTFLTNASGTPPAWNTRTWSLSRTG